MPDAEKMKIISFLLGVYLLKISGAIPLIFSILLAKLLQLVKERFTLKKNDNFPGGQVVKILGFHCKGHRFNPWSGK